MIRSSTGAAPTGRRWRMPIAVLAGALIAFGAAAQAADAKAADAKTADADARRTELDAEVTSTRQLGPRDVSLRDQAVLHLPAGHAFIPQPTAAKLMKSMGNAVDDKLIGLVYPVADDQQWMVVAEYEPSGYVKDDDARDWKANELLQSLKDGTQAANESRQNAGFHALEVTGWAQPPTYDAPTHRLVWAALAKQIGSAPTDAQVVNVNTYALGREGFISLNLLTDSQRVEADKVEARKLIGQLDFNEGKRYADFDGKTDHVAEYGLAALVAGVAVKKLGLLAVLAGSILKFWKLGLIALAGVGSVARKIFKRKPDGTPPAA